MACNSKTVVVEQTGVKFGDSVTLVTRIWGTFDLVGFKVIVGSFSTLFSKCLVTQKRLAIQQKELKFRT